MLFVGVRCPIETIMQRREINQEGREALYLRATEETPVPEPVQRWQDEVHRPGLYDMEVDTSVLTALECAEAIRHQLDLGVPEPSAFESLVAQR